MVAELDGDDLRKQVAAALRRLQWTLCAEGAFAATLPSDSGGCWLAAILSAAEGRPELLTPLGERSLRRLVTCGVSLRASWPRSWADRLAGWLGQRLYLSAAGNFLPSVKFTSIVSSAIGRHAQRLRDWPQLIDLALQSVAHRRQHLLLTAGSTLHDASLEFARRAGVARLEVECSTVATPSGWLAEALAAALSDSGVADLHSRLLVSPDIAERAGRQLPLQDRLATALADNIYALSIRKRGTIEQLLNRRLRDAAFPSGSVFVALPERSSAAGEHRFATDDWLARGGVGWYVPADMLPVPSELVGCGQRSRGQNAARHMRATHMWFVNAASVWQRLPEDESWSHLVHCTRGSAGPLPDESQLHFQHRAWLEGCCPEPLPLLTLNRICCEQRLRASSRITRTEQPCVSFSAVPLPELLRRRVFRPHLGRWDWEPYGILVRRQALQELGAQPVLYRPASEYHLLPESSRPYFQPHDGLSQPAGQDWSQEREWRLLGDLDLRRLGSESVALFVRTQTEARQLSRFSAWPVFWVDECLPADKNRQKK